jgi:hypothetical protein
MERTAIPLPTKGRRAQYDQQVTFARHLYFYFMTIIAAKARRHGWTRSALSYPANMTDACAADALSA